jgi:hypothetical protein
MCIVGPEIPVAFPPPFVDKNFVKFRDKLLGPVWLSHYENCFEIVVRFETLME